ncbi:LytR C-terminal domain-containing protein [Desulfonatronum lacustre]|uniref:LytR C-terminal domain-containing protein n=1 Tax=Desulfonatronum lacustre TaxID=66849 RepID=UPI00048D44B2|nr:LytR C-terminal domain-containing protein [Desulfonatronum lacustre]
MSDQELRRLVASARPFIRNPEMHFRQGLYFQTRGQHKLAVDEFAKVLLLEPDHIKALNAMAVSCDKLENYEQAVALYKQALSLDPDQDYIYNNLGYSYFLQGNYTAAVEAFQKAVTLDQSNTIFLNNLGMAYAQKGLFDQALAKFQRDPHAEHPASRVDPTTLFDNQTEIEQTETAQFEPEPRHWIRKLMPRPPGNTVSAPHIDPQVEPRVEPKSGNRTEPRTIRRRIEQAGPRVDPATQTTATPSPAPAAELQLSTGQASSGMPVTPDRQTNQHDFLKAVPVEVLNGSGVTRIAHDVGSYLEKNGFRVIRKKNADHFDHPRTIIHYGIGYLPAAKLLSRQFPGEYLLKEEASLDRFESRIRVVVGKDLDQRQLAVLGRRHVEDPAHHAASGQGTLISRGPDSPVRP